MRLGEKMARKKNKNKTTSKKRKKRKNIRQKERKKRERLFQSQLGFAQRPFFLFSSFLFPLFFFPPGVATHFWVILSHQMVEKNRLGLRCHSRPSLNVISFSEGQLTRYMRSMGMWPVGWWTWESVGRRKVDW